MNHDLSRRDFAKELATAATTLSAAVVASAAANVEAFADDVPAKKSEPERPDPVRDEAAAWLNQIRARYPDPHITPEILKDIAGDVLGDVMHCRKLNSFPLKNSDAPSFVCFAWSGANHAAQ